MSPLSSGTSGGARWRKRLWLGAALLAMLVWIGWEFRPWMPEGRAVHIEDAHFGEFDFQVWQRKNDSLSEPFATALFVRKSGGRWTAYLLDIQDTYRPSITMRAEHSGVAIFYGKSKRAFFNEEWNRFTLYHHNGVAVVIEGVAIDSEPPDDWWQRRNSK